MRRPHALVSAILVGLLGCAGVAALAYYVLVRPALVGVQIAAASAADNNPPLRRLLLALILAAQQPNLLPVSDDPDAPPQVFVVRPGETASDVALRLENAGLVRSGSALRWLLQYHGLDRSVEAGTFLLSPAMSAQQVAVALLNAQPEEVTIVVLEGWRLEQVAEACNQLLGIGAEIVELGRVSAQQYLPGWAQVPPQVSSLEGFLFPDTYRFAKDASAQDVLQAMVSNFSSRFDEARRAEAQAAGLTPYAVVTLASIVEREAVLAEERPIIAAVFLNRLRAGMRLEADPTVQYALGFQRETGRWWKVPLLPADITGTDSPYNTYRNAGLPPGPICNPGLAAIDAVLRPAQVPYLYFVARGDGSHAFATSFEEHLANVSRYQGG